MIDDYLQVGVITRPHGVRGEVKVFPTTDDNARFSKLKRAFIDTGKEYLEVTCVSAKYQKQFVILGFREIDNMDLAEKYRGCGILVAREDAVVPGKDEYFIADLIGMNVEDDTGEVKGTITNVIQTGANDVYDIAIDDGRNLLLPAIRECVLDVDVSARLMKIHILEGLLE